MPTHKPTLDILDTADDASTETWQPADAAPFGVVVLAHFLTRHGKSRVIRATRVAPYTVLDDSDYNYGTDYDEETGEYYLKAGWYERLVCGDYDYYAVEAVLLAAFDCLAVFFPNGLMARK